MKIGKLSAGLQSCKRARRQKKTEASMQGGKLIKINGNQFRLKAMWNYFLFFYCDEATQTR